MSRVRRGDMYISAILQNGIYSVFISIRQAAYWQEAHSPNVVLTC